MKIALITGTRPNLIKVSPTMAKMNATLLNKPILIHTGQHYDNNMFGVFLRELSIPKPDYILHFDSVDKEKWAKQIMKELKKVFIKEKIKLVILFGDVDSTLLSAVVAKRLGIKIVHIEAGLRCFDFNMSEERNRVTVDSLSDTLFSPSKDAVSHLLSEGVNKDKIHMVGNIMIDTLTNNIDAIKKDKTVSRLKLKGKEFAVCTFHRAGNVDNISSLKKFIKILSELQQKIIIVLPVHPRTEKMLRHFKLYRELKSLKNVILTKPLSYIAFNNLIINSKVVLTDSGGIQEETLYLKIPCLTMRENTERPITLAKGSNTLVGLNIKKITHHFDKIISGKHRSNPLPELWDGMTAGRIVDILCEKYRLKKNENI